MKSEVTARDLGDLSSPVPRVKYGRVKTLLAIARTRPHLLTPHFEFFSRLAASDATILKWCAIDIVGAIAAVDADGHVDRVLRALSARLREGRLITAGHALWALAHIARHRPQLQHRVTRAILRAEHLTYETPECRNIVLGHAVNALGTYVPRPPEGRDIVSFLERTARNPRPATRKKALKFLGRRTGSAS